MTAKPTDIPAAAPEQQAYVGPSPTPQAYRLEIVGPAGNKLVAISFMGPCGQWVIFMSPDGVDTFIDDLQTTTAEARSGVQIIRGSRLHLPGRS